MAAYQHVICFYDATPGIIPSFFVESVVLNIQAIHAQAFRLMKIIVFDS